MQITYQFVTIDVTNFQAAINGTWINITVVSVDAESETVTMILKSKKSKRIAVATKTFFSSYWRNRMPESTMAH